MFINRDVADELERKAHTYFICVGEQWQKVVVVALATAHAVAKVVECHAGDNGEVDGGVVGEHVACWLHYAVGSFGEVAWTGIVAQFHGVFASDSWQQYGLAAQKQRVNYGVGVHLVGQ